MPPLSTRRRFDLFRQTETPTLANGMTPKFPFASPERWNCTPGFPLSVESGGEGRLKLEASSSRSFQRLFHLCSAETSVPSVAFLCVLCVSFRKAQPSGHKSQCSREEMTVLWIFIFQGRVARANGIDILEKVRLLRIDAEILAKFLVLGSR